MTPEMRAFEYALGLYSVLIGLAIADIATSFHRLARSNVAVRWDPLALLAALFALLLAIGMWFDLWGVRNVTATRQFLFYLVMVAQLFLIFLIAAASLPDAAESDLRGFYSRNRRYFWALVALFQICYVALGLYFAGGLLRRGPPSLRIAFAVQMSILVLVPLALTRLRSRAFHYAGLALLIGTIAWHYSVYSIN